MTARTEPDPEERPREAPGAHPAPGGRVHFAAQAGQLANCGWAGPLSFRGERPEVWEGDAISRRGGRAVDCSVAGGDAAGWSRERAHGGLRGSPPPAPFAAECCAISPFSSSAGAHCARGRHRPRPPTSGHRKGGRRAGGVGEGAGGVTWGEGDVLPSQPGGKGRDFRRAGAAGGGARAPAGPGHVGGGADPLRVPGGAAAFPVACGGRGPSRWRRKGCVLGEWRLMARAGPLAGESPAARISNSSQLVCICFPPTDPETMAPMGWSPKASSR